MKKPALPPAALPPAALLPAALLISSALLFSTLFASCANPAATGGGAAATTAGPSAPAAKGAEPYTLPLVDKETVVSYATSDNPQGTVSYTEYLPAWVEFTKLTGIKIDFQVVPAASYNENIQTRLAAGMNLPDMLKLPPDPMQYAESGVIIPLDGLINKYAPNIVQLYSDRPEVRIATTAPDGKIYYLSSLLSARSIVNYTTALYRKDWFEKLNQSGSLQLETMDDWRVFLEAMRDADMNGDGDATDEIPMTVTAFANLNYFAWPYGLMLDVSDTGAEYEYWQAGADGKVFCMWTDPRLKLWLEEMNKWYSEGLIDKDAVGDQPGEAMTAKVLSDKAGAVVGASMITPQWTTNMSVDHPEAYWEVAYPPKGPNGDRLLVRERAVSSEFYAISRDCKNPELVIKVLDFIYANRQGQMLVGNWGIEGVSYEMVNGKPEYLPLIKDDIRGDGAAISEFGINGPWPRILMREYIEFRFFKFPQSKNAADAAAKYQIDSFPMIIPTNEENQKLISTLADITTYRKEMITRFIIGSEPLSNFDQYVSTIKGMGIDDLVALKQAQYDRALGK